MEWVNGVAILIQVIFLGPLPLFIQMLQLTFYTLWWRETLTLTLYSPCDVWVPPSCPPSCPCLATTGPPRCRRNGSGRSADWWCSCRAGSGQTCCCTGWRSSPPSGGRRSCGRTPPPSSPPTGGRTSRGWDGTGTTSGCRYCRWSYPGFVVHPSQYKISEILNYNWQAIASYRLNSPNAVAVTAFNK